MRSGAIIHHGSGAVISEDGAAVINEDSRAVFDKEDGFDAVEVMTMNNANQEEGDILPYSVQTGCMSTYYCL